MTSSTKEQMFTCPKCNYVAQVAGKRYYEIEWQFHIETRKCKSCFRLFDNIVTKTLTSEEVAAQSAEFYKVYANHKWNDVLDEIKAHGEYLKQIKGINKVRVNCRWCGSAINEVWSMENPTCPKCGSMMDVSEGMYYEDRMFEYYASFNELINSSPKIVVCLLDAECGICRHVRLMMNEILQENPEEFRFLEFDSNYTVENNLHTKYKLKYLPTFLHFKDGRFVGKFSNVDSKPDLLKKIRKRFNKK